jgi:hypothetical protein
VADQFVHSPGLPLFKAGYLEHDRSRSNDSDPMIYWAFTLSHTCFSRMFRNRLVWENANPNASSTLRRSGDRCSACLNLSACDPRAFQRLDTVLAKCNFCASTRYASPLSAKCLSMLGSSWE